MFLLRERVFSSLPELPHLLLLASFCSLINAQFSPYGGTPPAQWTNNPTAMSSFSFPDGTTIRSILQVEIPAPLTINYNHTFACGFYCNGACSNYMFAIYIIQTNSDGSLSLLGQPQVVWSANRNRPVKINSTLTLTSDGGLSLEDFDGTVVWSTNTSGTSVARSLITDDGNLLLLDKYYATIWQSFDYPTDSLVLGQTLTVGQKLTASVSSLNSTQLPLLSFTVTRERLSGLMETDPPQIYYSNLFPIQNDTLYVQYLNGSLSLFVDSEFVDTLISFPPASSAQYVRLDSLGHLDVYDWSEVSVQWLQVADPLSNNSRGNCSYPLTCGTYGICSRGQCSCPTSTFFKQNDDGTADLGCSLVTPLSCGAAEDQSFVELRDVLYFAIFEEAADVNCIDRESCQQVCAETCSCKAAIFQYGQNESNGYCYLLSEIFSLMSNEQGISVFNYTTYIKVQNPAPPIPSPAPIPNVKGKSYSLPIILSALSAVTLLIGYLIWRTKHADGKAAEEDDYLDQLPEMPSRLSYGDLNAATLNFSNKLGSGGFGSVFKGTLLDGTKVAVKKLEGFGHMKDSFLAEVKTIGSIHHVNLVRLVGFCAEKSHPLLVYEYMANGSLDRWIFHKKNCQMLKWQQRKKIVLDIAKGLHYLHEECRQKIIHLDIKPQNILLDESFNAKVSDFGLAKLMDRDQSQVVTTMKGTPGYLAPEWLSSMISEKVDVYSFGVVILEVMCGRRVFDDSLDEEEKHLLGIFKQKAEEDKLLEMVDKYSKDMQLHGLEAVDMMKVAAWCLQGDFAKRPSMAMAIKVLLEGFTNLQVDLDYNFLNPTWVNVKVTKGEKVGVTTLLLPSVLSGPR